MATQSHQSHSSSSDGPSLRQETNDSQSSTTGKFLLYPNSVAGASVGMYGFWVTGRALHLFLTSLTPSLSTHGILLQSPPIIIRTLVLNHEDADYQNPPRGGQAGSTRGLEPKRNRQGQKEE